jgi:hypothetical protein
VSICCVAAINPSYGSSSCRQVDIFVHFALLILVETWLRLSTIHTLSVCPISAGPTTPIEQGENDVAAAALKQSFVGQQPAMRQAALSATAGTDA